MALVLLADQPAWARRLRACLAAADSRQPLLVAEDWDDVRERLDGDQPCVVLATPSQRPLLSQCRWPVILLLEQEPSETPEGVVDWLVRSQLSPEVLRRCLRYVRERCNLQGTLQRLAEHDPLTGIVNRQGFQAQLMAALAEHHGRGLALGYLDLDNFRRANDALGHAAGDRLMLQVVARLETALEAGDSLARLGSDDSPC